jgi:hypothetical protein
LGEELQSVVVLHVEQTTRHSKWGEANAAACHSLGVVIPAQDGIEADVGAVAATSPI